MQDDRPLAGSGPLTTGASSPASPTVLHATLLPADWPASGTIDLTAQDLPHASSTLEWWYVNAHLLTSGGRELSLFASFFRTAIGHDDTRGELTYAGAMTWAIVDPAGQRYLRESLVDQRAPEIVRLELDQGLGIPDATLRRALYEMVERGSIPGPDLTLDVPCLTGTERLFLDYGGRRLEKPGAGEYVLRLCDASGITGCDITFRLVKPVIRHGADGLVQGQSGERMFYYFSPRAAVEGTVTIDGVAEPIASGSAWYDHEFGRADEHESRAGTGLGTVSWDWLSVQLDHGWELSIYCLVDDRSGTSSGRYAILVDPSGHAEHFERFTFTGSQPWTSSKTFARYPTAWLVEIPEADLRLDVQAAFPAQEFVTMISRPGFWEGRVVARGTQGDSTIQGCGFVERSGFERNETLPAFFGAVGSATRRSVELVLPRTLDEAAAAGLAGGARHLTRVELWRLERTLVEPVRAVVDRGGKAWRSYLALACCDAVGGDSQFLLDWLALPELMHVGSLMVDDIQDGSLVRRGGPAVHTLYGDAITINAGTACYFLPQLFVLRTPLTDAEKLRCYDQYFEATRAAHAGQALDLAGCADAMSKAVESGDGARVERHVRAVHHLKSATPAGCLARIGAVLGGGSEAQVEALGRFVEGVGLAFQIVDDVLNLRGFDGDGKTRGEDIAAGKITMPVALAMSRLGKNDRQWLWATLGSRPGDPAVVREAIALLEASGAIAECRRLAEHLVEDGWTMLSPLLPDSQSKLMLRAFSWFVLERHY